MNNDPIPSFAARQQRPQHNDHEDDNERQHDSTTQDNRRRGGIHATVEEDNNNDAGPSSAPAVAAEEPRDGPSRKQKRKDALAKKLQFMTHLQRSLDMVVFAYICTLYYMECSFTRLLLRVMPHYIFISPKDALLLLPAHRPHVFAILAPNLLCILLHVIFSPPQAGEATRGYLHGGAIIDFVGQQPSTSKLGLLFLDVVILAVQCLMLTVHQERERLRKAVLPSLRAVGAAVSTGEATAASVDRLEEGPTVPSTQDQDAEERGVLRDEEGAIELQPLHGGSIGGNDRDPDASHESNSSSGNRQAVTYSHTGGNVDMLDVLRSGNAVLGNFHVVHAVRTVGNDYQRAAAYSLQSLGYTASLAAAIAADRRARIQGQQTQ
ncbi:hypothetical protein B0H66DRAFT_468182 [Apodospora peruviana]|uniref:DUF1746 domain-containing protein n=1 Tax=Apodospora peruviana TaxID=516989 RepID=A0AAE0ISD3_9PEZI|nr:hypothetical protein B0H66DRAFT_468182 [Apodospora peruviana]